MCKYFPGSPMNPATYYFTLLGDTSSTDPTQFLHLPCTAILHCNGTIHVCLRKIAGTLFRLLIHLKHDTSVCTELFVRNTGNVNDPEYFPNFHTNICLHRCCLSNTQTNTAQSRIQGLMFMLMLCVIKDSFKLLFALYVCYVKKCRYILFLANILCFIFLAGSFTLFF
jgi:hypothetical protein